MLFSTVILYLPTGGKQVVSLLRAILSQMAPVSTIFLFNVKMMAVHYPVNEPHYGRKYDRLQIRQGRRPAKGDGQKCFVGSTVTG
jgi:hypothetical protein